MYPQKDVPRKISVSDLPFGNSSRILMDSAEKPAIFSGAKVVFLYKDEVLEIPAEILLLAGHAPLRK